MTTKKRLTETEYAELFEAQGAEQEGFRRTGPGYGCALDAKTGGEED